MSDPKSDKSRVRRIPKRGHYDRETVHAILDETSVCHVGFDFNGYPVIIPTIYGRKGDFLYLHGATTSRMLKTIEEGGNICISVTHVDAIVLARSLFHSSMNYRSVVIFGKGELVEENEKMKALEIVSDQIIPNRWNEARLPTSKELKATKLIKVKIEEASAKIRTGPPGDDKEDYALDIWAGIIPMHTKPLEPLDDPLLKKGIQVPASVKRFVKDNSD